jgi:hypothetical protein
MVEKTSKHNTSTVIVYLILAAGAIQRHYDQSNTILHRLTGATGVILLVLTGIAYLTLFWVSYYGIRKDARIRKAFMHDSSQKSGYNDIPVLIQGLIIPVLLAVNGFMVIAIIKLIANMLRPFLMEILGYLNRNYLKQFED